MGTNIINWSIDFSHNTITVEIPPLGTKIPNENNPVAEFRRDGPNYRKFFAKISADFELRQLLLNGYKRYRISRGESKRTKTTRYENVIITSW